DHDVNQTSVESRTHLSPLTTGSGKWSNSRQIVYVHATLSTNTVYEVILEPGYRDPAGNTYTLRHHWSFVTEGPPALSASNPSDGESGVDPSAYLSLDFSRAMEPASIKSAIALSPSVPFDVRIDQADSRRAIIAPSQLLSANTDYRLLLDTAALDVDGNQLGRNQLVKFSTGALRPLSHWIAFATAGPAGPAGGLWIVNERGFPRELFDSSPVDSFSWSPGGGGRAHRAARRLHQRDEQPERDLGLRRGAARALRVGDRLSSCGRSLLGAGRQPHRVPPP